MPAQKRQHPPPAPLPQPASDDHPAVAAVFPPPPSLPQRHQDEKDEEMAEGEEKPPTNSAQEQDGCGGEGGGSSSEDDAADQEEFVLVRLADIRKEVQCPICLGIIRKTRTVMECLHRFCRACIDKSMRLGNNECPACRTHCASRRSLRDDLNYDSLIAAIYPDIDKYEEEELAFHEEEKSRNKKLQASIAEIFRRQSEALGRRRSTAKATTAAFVRRSQGNYRNHVCGRGGTGGHDTMLAASDDDDDDDDDDDEEEANVNDVGKNYSSTDEPSPDRRQKRHKRQGALQSSPARTAANADAGSEENDDFEANREQHLGTSPLQSGNRDMLVWGKNGARSQTRHGNTSGSNGRMVKGGHMTKLVNYLRNVDDADDEVKGGRMTKLVNYLREVDDADDEFDVHLTLVPLDKETVANLHQPYLCCRPTLSIGHLCKYIALQTSVPAEEVQIYARTPQGGASATKRFSSTDMANNDPLMGLQKLEGQESLATLPASFTSNQGELVLVYHLKTQS